MTSTCGRTVLVQRGGELSLLTQDRLRWTPAEFRVRVAAGEEAGGAAQAGARCVQKNWAAC